MTRFTILYNMVFNHSEAGSQNIDNPLIVRELALAINMTYMVFYEDHNTTNGSRREKPLFVASELQRYRPTCS